MYLHDFLLFGRLTKTAIRVNQFRIGSFFKGDNSGSGQDTTSQCSTRIEEEDAELGTMDEDLMNSATQTVSISVYNAFFVVL